MKIINKNTLNDLIAKKYKNAEIFASTEYFYLLSNNKVVITYDSESTDWDTVLITVGTWKLNDDGIFCANVFGRSVTTDKDKFDLLTKIAGFFRFIEYFDSKDRYMFELKYAEKHGAEYGIDIEQIRDFGRQAGYVSPLFYLRT